MGDLMDEAERTIRRLRADAREQQEDAEAVVAELAMAARSLRDVVLDHARQGRSIRAEIGSTILAGSVVHVGADLLRLVGPERPPIDLVLSAVTSIRSVDLGGDQRTVSVGYPDTLLARCRELVQVNARVEMGRHDAGSIRGALMAATASHFELVDDADGAWIVPIDSAVWVGRIDARG